MLKKHNGMTLVKDVLEALSQGDVGKAVEIVGTLKDNHGNSCDEGLVFMLEGLINSYKVAKGKSRYASSVAFVGNNYKQLSRMLKNLEKVLKVAGMEFDLSAVHCISFAINNKETLKLIEKAFSSK